MSEPRALFHYTCQHVADRLGVYAVLQPLRGHAPEATKLLPRPLRWMSAVLWLTDLEEPNRAALGLTSVTLHCDRTERRYRVDDWAMIRPLRWSDARGQYPALHVMELESPPGAQPEHWWISTVDQPAKLDPIR